MDVFLEKTRFGKSCFKIKNIDLVEKIYDLVTEDYLNIKFE